MPTFGHVSQAAEAGAGAGAEVAAGEGALPEEEQADGREVHVREEQEHHDLEHAAPRDTALQVVPRPQPNFSIQRIACIVGGRKLLNLVIQTMR